MHRWFVLLVCMLPIAACREERAPVKVASPSGSQASVASTLGSQTSVARTNAAPVSVETYGELRAMMHEGKTGPVVNLGSILTPTVYGLGALSELRGEVTILGGNVWLAYPEEGDNTRVETTTSTTESAALFVAANVQSWKAVPIPDDIEFSALDQRIEALASAAGVDVEKPFPVLVEGELTGLRWHVIDGRRLTPGPSSHEQHMRMAAKGEAPLVRATLLGFFSKQHQGVFTHRGQNIHFHFIDPEKRLSGHVDAVGIRKGAILKVPS